MPNFGSDFARSFNLQPAANLISQLIVGNAQQKKAQDEKRQTELLAQDKKRQTELLAQQEQNQQNKSISELLTGKTYTPYPVKEQRDLTPEEKIGLMLGLNKEGRSQYEWMNKTLNPSKPKTPEPFSFGGKLYPRDTQGNIDFNNPIIEQSKKPETIMLPPSNWQTDNKTKSVLAQKGYYVDKFDKNDPSIIDVNGKPFKVTEYLNKGQIKTKDEKGNNVLGLPQKAIFDNWFKTQQGYKYALQSGLPLNDKEGNSIRSQTEQNLINYNKKYAEMVKSTMPESAMKWYNGLFNINKANLSKEEFWNNLVNTYINGNLGRIKGKKEQDDILDFQYLRELYRATYGEDAPVIYGNNYAQ